LITSRLDCCFLGAARQSYAQTCRRTKGRSWSAVGSSTARTGSLSKMLLN